jgi:triosephosphate isomerase (TIM)
MPPERRPYVAANWKMWGTRADARAHIKQLLPLLPDPEAVDVGLCVPFTALATAVSETDGSAVKVAAQNMHQDESGAYTGEISAPMLLELNVGGVVLGHSERRQYYGETDAALCEKLPGALAAGLEPILCVGESEQEHEAGETERKLRHQVQTALEQVELDRLPEVVIAYEPIWAIGTGTVATPDQAQDAIAFIRALVGDRDTDAAERVRLLYGGSVKPDNAAELLTLPDVDGALVGGASLDPAGLAQIAAAAA